MSKKEMLLKEDINFLENPDWIISEKKKIREYTVIKNNGKYHIATSSDRLPNRFDKIVLYSLLHELYKKNNLKTNIINTTRYKIAKNAFYNNKGFGNTEYKRVMLALKRWNNISIEFEGIFYEDNEYTERYFHIIDDVILNKKSKELMIKFNEQYVESLRKSKYYKLINFNEYKRLKKPISARLYEILIKNFKSREIWKIEIINLSEKITLQRKFPSDIIIKLKPAINEINKNTELKIDFSTYKNDDNETICIFKNKEHKTQIEQMDINFKKDRSESSAYKFVLYEKSTEPLILKIINGFTGDQDVLVSNIKYTNKNAKDNYAQYLRMALNKDWGKYIREQDKELKDQYKDLIEASMEQTLKLTKANEDECRELIFESMMDMKNRINNEKYFTPEYIYPIIKEMWERQHYSRREKTFEELERLK